MKLSAPSRKPNKLNTDNSPSESPIRTTFGCQRKCRQLLSPDCTDARVQSGFPLSILERIYKIERILKARKPRKLWNWAGVEKPSVQTDGDVARNHYQRPQRTAQRQETAGCWCR
jgi:hypothetical protein